MSKIIIIGEKTSEQKKLVPISFKRYLNEGIEIECGSVLTPLNYNFIELICKDYGSGYDIMFAYDDPKKRRSGTFYIGHWNDGVAE